MLTLEIPGSIREYASVPGITSIVGAGAGFWLGDAVGTFTQTLTKTSGALGYIAKLIGGIIAGAILFTISKNVTGIASTFAKAASLAAPAPVIFELLTKYVPLAPHAQAAALSISQVAFSSANVVEQAQLKPIPELSKRALQVEVEERPLVKRTI